MICHRRAVRRFPFMTLLFVPLLWLTWGWQALPVQNGQVRIVSIIDRVTQADRAALGPFALEQVWRLSSGNKRFGGYSALVPLPSGQFLAVSDRNTWFRFAPPVQAGTIALPMGRMLVHRPQKDELEYFDTEAAVRDPLDGSLWIALEDDWHVAHIAKQGEAARFYPVPALRDWPENGGAEAMTRLADGRWVMLCETCGGGRGGLHLGLLFAGYPGTSAVQKFGIVLPAGYAPVDMAPLPDGRLLILTRAFAMFPAHFSNRLVLADLARLDGKRPLATRELARIEGSALRENYEGLAIRPAPDGQVEVWLISDANDSAFQETRLMQLRLDSAKLPTQK
ncbi:hypothetical protein IP81_06390 [Novosphingobium sp. AAP83]|nr:hypothetical protein IP81_06390 [Novosphingobium sp. AAP83]